MPPEFVRYVIPRTMIDGPAWEDGAEVELRVRATVEAMRLGSETVWTLRLSDWAGPVAVRERADG